MELHHQAGRDQARQEEVVKVISFQALSEGFTRIRLRRVNGYAMINTSELEKDLIARHAKVLRQIADESEFDFLLNFDVNDFDNKNEYINVESHKFKELRCISILEETTVSKKSADYIRSICNNNAYILII